MIFLSVLKIIGIVLASLVGFVIFLLLLVLFAPVGYRLTGKGEGSDIEGVGKAAWIFGLVSAKAFYREKNLEYKVSVIGIPIIKGGLGKDFKKSDLEDSVEETSEQESIPKEEKVKKKEKKRKKSEDEDFDLDIEIINLDKDISKFRRFKRSPEKKIEVENERDSIIDAIEDYIDNLSEKYDKIKNKANQFKIVLTSKAAKRALKVLKVRVINILNHIKPKKIAGNLNFGLEDPANTAIIYGTVDIIAEYMSKGKLILVPDFTQKLFNMDLVISGRIFIGYVVYSGLKLILNRDVKRVVKVIRRII